MAVTICWLMFASSAPKSDIFFVLLLASELQLTAFSPQLCSRPATPADEAGPNEIVSARR
jgi:hypothetical protein